MLVSLEDNLESGSKNTNNPVQLTPPVIEHAKDGHKIDWDNVKILDKECDWFRRGVQEDIIYMRTKRSDLNKDQGRHRLSKANNFLL